MKKVLVTGGTVFVSRYAAQYFLRHGYDVYVLNRNTKPQAEGVKLIESDRHALGDKLKGIHFDAVLDITAYDEEDVTDLLNALDTFDHYILISTSAVYPETEARPFTEETRVGENILWGKYGTNKIAAEKALFERVPHAYSLRPPYIYGPMNNAYREAFVFDCILNDRKFYLPKTGDLQLQFFHIRDLCEVMRRIIETSPEHHIFNVGNPQTISAKEWVEMCYACAGKTPEFVNVYSEHPQYKYFPFVDYYFMLDVTKQSEILPVTIDMQEGLKESFEWYTREGSEAQVNKRPYIEFIEENLI